MTNKTFRTLLKAIAAFAITAAFGSASFAGDFTVHQGKRYRATLTLNSVERLADNALIARKFRALGFSKVRVSGAGAVRRVEGVWHRKDASATLPRQIVAVARCGASRSDPTCLFHSSTATNPNCSESCHADH
jgi:hypothetical protein